MNLSLWPLYLNVVFLWAIWVLTVFFKLFFVYSWISFNLWLLYFYLKKKWSESKCVREWTLVGLVCLGNTLYCLCDQTATFTTSSARHALGLVPPCGNAQGHTTVLSYHTLWQITVGALSSASCRNLVLVWVCTVLCSSVLSLSGSACLLNSCARLKCSVSTVKCGLELVFWQLFVILSHALVCYICLCVTRCDMNLNVFLQNSADVYMAYSESCYCFGFNDTENPTQSALWFSCTCASQGSLISHLMLF